MPKLKGVVFGMARGAFRTVREWCERPFKGFDKGSRMESDWSSSEGRMVLLELASCVRGAIG